MYYIHTGVHNDNKKEEGKGSTNSPCSGTSHNRLSEIRTASIQWTKNVTPIDFAIEITHFQPLKYGLPPISG